MSRPQLPTDSERSALMQRVRRRGTPAEVTVAALCREIGLHYRLNVTTLPGSPDLANKAKRWAIFVNGCFWHGHKNCRLAKPPKRNREFWERKFADNRARDARKARELRRLGFVVAIVWQCETTNENALSRRLQSWAKRVS
ncbi:MAG: very short patch repair endonuclease [Methylocystis sp.]|nr:MAG: very short patch repair endonuclease [Methylocystis sp.]